MQEIILSIINSPNALIVFIFVLLVIGFLGIASSKGLIKANIKGIKLGKTENETRAFFLKCWQWLEIFISSEKQGLIASMKEKGFEMKYLPTSYIFEKVQDEIVRWLMVNHIDESKEYIDDKKDAIRQVVGGELGKVNNDLRNNAEYMNSLFEYCDDFTERVIKKLAKIKKDDGF